MIRALLLATFLSTCACALAACGQKGPLELPDPAPAKPAPAAP